MHGSEYVFTKEFFTFWVVVAILWGFTAACIITFMPVVESLSSIVKALTGGAPDAPAVADGGRKSPEKGDGAPKSVELVVRSSSDLRGEQAPSAMP